MRQSDLARTLFEKYEKVHGDVQPANIFISGNSDTATVMLADNGGTMSLETYYGAPQEVLPDILALHKVLVKCLNCDEEGIRVIQQIVNEDEWKKFHNEMQTKKNDFYHLREMLLAIAKEYSIDIPIEPDTADSEYLRLVLPINDLWNRFQVAPQALRSKLYNKISALDDEYNSSDISWQVKLTADFLVMKAHNLLYGFLDTKKNVETYIQRLNEYSNLFSKEAVSGFYAKMLFNFSDDMDTDINIYKLMYNFDKKYLYGVDFTKVYAWGNWFNDTFDCVLQSGSEEMIEYSISSLERSKEKITYGVDTQIDLYFYTVFYLSKLRLLRGYNYNDSDYYRDLYALTEGPYNSPKYLRFLSLHEKLEIKEKK